jgi:hypothetical protein
VVFIGEYFQTVSHEFRSIEVRVFDSGFEI